MASKENTAYETITGLSKGEALGNLLPRIEQFVFYLGLGVCVIFVILSGYQFFFGESDSSKKNVEDAQKSLTYALAGFVILLLLRALFQIIAGIFGYNLDASTITK